MSLYLNKSILGNIAKCTFYGGTSSSRNTLHISPNFKYPQAVALKLPTNVVDINAAEMGRFSPLRQRDLSGPVINSYYSNRQAALSQFNMSLKTDPHVNKYDCQGALSLSSSMQSNVPEPFSGNHTHLGMPGSQWGQGHKYLSDHLHSAHYLNLKNEYRFQTRASTEIIRRSMTTHTSEGPPLSSKEKLKRAVKEYGSIVVVFHVGISLVSLGTCYALVSSGVDVVGLLKYFEISEGAITKIATSNAGTFVLSYAVHKFFAPFRIAITLTATPFIVKYLRQIGYLKLYKSGGGK